jgi:superoxide dismutase, Fe-Mn family
MTHVLPKLPYEYNSLEPFIDENTMRIHHGKHHQTYVDKLNAALEGYPDLKDKPVDALIRDLDSVPEKIRGAVRNHGGGHFNHSFFWPILKKDVKPAGELMAAITKKFGSFENFRKDFSDSALSVFGSGWAWLVLDKNNIMIMTTPNQDSPISQGRLPVLGIDVWEHAYYLKYQNRRADYISAFFNVIDWKAVNDNYLRAMKK